MTARWSKYDDVRDLTEGVKDFDHPDTVAELDVWRRLDTGDPLLWAKYRRGSRM